MKLKHFSFSVSANVLVTKAEIADIIKVAESHYDGACKRYANRLRFDLDYSFKEKDEITIFFDFDGLDTIAKILEQGHLHGVDLYFKWSQIFRQVRDESERINAHWMMLDTEKYTQVYRDELKAKYGAKYGEAYVATIPQQSQPETSEQ